MSRPIIEVSDSGMHGLDDFVYTALCALPDTPRGSYDEEIDLIVRGGVLRGGGRRPGETALRRAAEAEIERNYDRALRVRRIRRVW